MNEQQYRLMVAHALHVYLGTYEQVGHDRAFESIIEVVPEYFSFYNEHGPALVAIAEQLFPRIRDKVGKGANR